MSKRVVESPYNPRPHSLAFHARSERFAILVMHRRAGKTVMCINDLIDKALQNKLPMPRYGYIAPLYKQAKDVAWSYLKMYAAPVIERVMESELSVQLVNGALIRLYGADNPDSLRGIYFDGAILDEYGDMQPRLFGEVIAPTLTDRRGWAVFIGTPKGPNHFYELWEDSTPEAVRRKAAERGIPEVHWLRQMLKASESGIIPADELALAATLPGSDEDTFRQEFECDFQAAVRGAYYGKQLNGLESTNMGSFPWDPDLQVLTAWDIGYTDDTSIWFYQVNGREIKVIDFFTVAGYSVGDVLGVLRSKPYAYGMAYLPHDAKNRSFQTGKSTRELMIEDGLRTQIVPSLSIQDGIQAVRKTLPRVYFNTDNADVRIGVNALRVYQRKWDDKRRMFSEQPLHDWSSNPADAFRMLALATTASVERSGSRGLNTPKVVPIRPGASLNLNTLFAEREAQMRNRGRI